MNFSADNKPGNLADEAWISELSAAEESWKKGLDGRARVCCRRAVGEALRTYRRDYVQQNPIHATGLLTLFSRRDDVPLPIRQAAARLTKNVRDRLSPEFTFNPILDAKKIIAFLKQLH